MKTALEILTDARLHTSYWGKRIIKAEKRGRFTENDSEMVADWMTCACGKQDPRIPRLDFETCIANRSLGCLGAPADSELREKGVIFYNHIKEHRFVDAARTLVKIEKRASIVLRMAQQQEKE